MKFVRFDGGKTGLVIELDVGGQVLDVMASMAALRRHDAAAVDAIEAVLPAFGPQPWIELIGGWDDLREPFKTLEAAAATAPGSFAFQAYDMTQLEAPIAAPTAHIYGAGSNTTVHAQRAFKAMKNLELHVDDVMKPKREGAPPSGFTIWPDFVVGPRAVVTPPRGFRKLDYEAECAVYVKRGGRDLKLVEIWGYTAWNDFGVRDPHLGLMPEAAWIPYSLNLPKNFDGGNSCGPWVVVDEGRDVGALRCALTVNGEQRQDWNLSDMIYGFNDILAFISSYHTLRPGDMVTSGTGAGVAIEGGVNGPLWLKPGDVVEVLLEGLAPLSNTIGAW